MAFSRVVLVGLLVLAGACGAGNGSPTQPTTDWIELNSIAPAAGSALKPGERVTFAAVVTCTIATGDGGLVSMVVQDHRNESLTPGEPSPTARLQKGTTTVTLTHSAVVPADGSAVKVFLPLFVDGSNTTRAMKIVDYTVG